MAGALDHARPTPDQFERYLGGALLTCCISGDIGRARDSRAQQQELSYETCRPARRPAMARTQGCALGAKERPDRAPALILVMAGLPPTARASRACAGSLLQHRKNSHRPAQKGRRPDYALGVKALCDGP
jgi:hypothetical protein